MGVLKLGFLSILVVGVGVFFTLDRFEAQRNSIIGLLNTCPLHWFGPSGTESNTVDGVYNVISADGDRLFTKDELAEYHGEEGSKGLYLGILGRVYDVEKGRRFYGEGGGYGFFRAIDGTKAFMTGEFNKEGLVDEIEGLTQGQMIELEDWIKFYDTTYTYVGKLIGNFYDKDGKPTALLHEAVQRMKEAHIEKQKQQDFKKRFPSCNSYWKQQSKDKRFWCTTQSGGVKRDWVGVPRKYYSPGSDSGKCVCVRTEGPPSDDPKSSSNRGDLDNPNLREYENCDPTSNECLIPVN